MKVTIPFSELQASYAAIQAIAKHVDIQAIKDALTSKNFEESLEECEGAGWKITTSGIEFEIPSEKINQASQAMVAHAGFIGGVVTAVAGVVKLLDSGLKPFLREAFGGPNALLKDFLRLVSEIVGEPVNAADIRTIWNGDLLIGLKVFGEHSYTIDMLIGVVKSVAFQKNIKPKHYKALRQFEARSLKAALEKAAEANLTPRQEHKEKIE